MSSPCFRVREHIVPAQYIRDYPVATANSQEETLQLHVKQYTPLDVDEHQPGAITIIATHANGFPKELYEPLWEELFGRSKANGFAIRGIWMADMANQGMSSVLNEDKLGTEPSWLDHVRDLLLMINHFRKQMPRPLVGIGHSFGGTQLINLSLMHPRLLTTLVLLDPVVQDNAAAAASLEVGTVNIAHASTYRRDLWPSRGAAAAAFAKSSFYQAWDKRVFDLWIRYGLRDLPTAVYPDLPKGSDVRNPPVTLATTKHQEVWTFLRPRFGGRDASDAKTINRSTHADVDPSIGDYPFYRPEPLTTYHMLPHVRPSALWLLGADSRLSTREMLAGMRRMGTGVGGSGGEAEGRVKATVLPNVGHLVPMEAVDKTAEESAQWLGQEMERWREEEERWQEWRARRSKRDYLVVDDEWKRHIGPPRPSGKAPLAPAKL